MNRILKKNNNLYQVMITPTFISNSSMELILGQWIQDKTPRTGCSKKTLTFPISDEHIRGYRVAEFSTLQDAMDLAFKYPTIDWNKLVNIHQDAFPVIVNTVRNTLANGSFIVEIDSHLMNPTELKETMFKRVLRNGERFNLFYDANDVISINIINPWTRNIIEMANLLRVVPNLRIKKIIRSETHITLIGVTDADTTFEIRLWTSLIAQWVRWVKNNDIDPHAYIGMLSQIMEKQKIIDDGDIIR
jgi:hypothetical protein